MWHTLTNHPAHQKDGEAPAADSKSDKKDTKTNEKPEEKPSGNKQA